MSEPFRMNVTGATSPDYCTASCTSAHTHPYNVQGESTSDCKALTALLSPQGRLVSALHSADADALIMFKFPPERLPSHTQMLLGNDLGRHAPLPGPG